MSWDRIEGQWKQRQGKAVHHWEKLTNNEIAVTNGSYEESVGAADSDAKFLGWQETLAGKFLPLFNITVEGHPSFGSTVTGERLRKLNLQVPDISLAREPVREF